jgi:hypothetical protein
VDLTVEVMLPPRGSSDFDHAPKRGYPMLCPVAVYPVQKIAPVVGMPRSGYVHVIGVPPGRFAQLHDALMATAATANRAWVILHTRLSQADKDELIEHRQIAVSWSEFRSLLRNVPANRDLTDDDVPATDARARA